MASPATELEVGSDFAGRYRVVRCLKRGGMGSVYEVVDRRTDRLRALKIMQPEIAKDADLRARFEREASIVGRVRSDHIIEVVDAGVCEPDTPFLVMELLAGEDLGARVERGPLEVGVALSLLEQVARGLDKVHADGVIHRDLKLENLFVTRRDDGSDHVKLLDFGIAKALDPSSLGTTRSLGTPLYMAPEQLTGDGTIGPAADLYALAHVAYSMLVGKPYWSEEAKSASNAYAFISRVVRGAVEPPTERARRDSVTLPRAFDAWFSRATSFDPGARFETAHEQIDALRVALGAGVSSALGPVELAPTRRAPVKTKVFAIAGAALVVTFVVAWLAIGANRSSNTTSLAPSSSEAQVATAEASATPSAQAPRAVEVTRTSAASSSSPLPATSPVRSQAVVTSGPRASSLPSARPTASIDPLDEY
ncbi:MAG: serine/threonine-protein kinase [Polyangiaceae bacterium]